MSKSEPGIETPWAAATTGTGRPRSPGAGQGHVGRAEGSWKYDEDHHRYVFADQGDQAGGNEETRRGGKILNTTPHKSGGPAAKHTGGGERARHAGRPTPRESGAVMHQTPLRMTPSKTGRVTRRDVREPHTPSGMQERDVGDAAASTGDRHARTLNSAMSSLQHLATQSRPSGSTSPHHPSVPQNTPMLDRGTSTFLSQPSSSPAILRMLNSLVDEARRRGGRAMDPDAASHHRGEAGPHPWSAPREQQEGGHEPEHGRGRGQQQGYGGHAQWEEEDIVAKLRQREAELMSELNSERQRHQQEMAAMVARLQGEGHAQTRFVAGTGGAHIQQQHGHPERSAVYSLASHPQAIKPYRLLPSPPLDKSPTSPRSHMASPRVIPTSPSTVQVYEQNAAPADSILQPHASWPHGQVPTLERRDSAAPPGWIPPNSASVQQGGTTHKVR